MRAQHAELRERAEIEMPIIASLRRTGGEVPYSSRPATSHHDLWHPASNKRPAGPDLPGGLRASRSCAKSREVRRKAC